MASYFKLTVFDRVDFIQEYIEPLAYKEYKEKTKSYSENKWNNLSEKMNNIFKEFSLCMKNGEELSSEKVHDLVKRLQKHITENYYQCTNEVLKRLGLMYVEDERFKNNIDKHADGTAKFVSEAIEVYCNNKIRLSKKGNLIFGFRHTKRR